MKATQLRSKRAESSAPRLVGRRVLTIFSTARARKLPGRGRATGHRTPWLRLTVHTLPEELFGFVPVIRILP